MKFREGWEDHTQIETLSLRSLKSESKEKLEIVFSISFFQISQKSFTIRNTIHFNCIKKIPILNKNITTFDYA